MGRLSLKNMIMISVFFIFLLSTGTLFYIFNEFYKRNTKEKFINENNYSATVAKELLEKEKNEMLLMARELAKNDVVFYGTKTGTYIAVDETTIGKDKEPKIITSKMNKLRYITLLNLSRRTRDLNRQIFRYDKTEKRFYLEAASRGMSFGGNDGSEKYLFDSIGDGVKAAQEFTFVEEKDDVLYIKAVCPIGLDTRWLPLILANAENIPGIVVSAEQIEGAFLASIKKIINKEVILVKNKKIIGSTLYDENAGMMKNEMVDIDFKAENDFFNIETNISGKKMLVTFFPIRDYNGKVVAYMGTGIGTDEVLAVFSKSIKSFIIYEIIFALFLMIILYFVLVRSFKPLGQIVGHIKNIGNGYYSDKITVETQQELKILAESVNNLADIVQKRETELRSINQTLEKKVAERTKKLQLSINRLKSIGRMISTVFTERKERNAIAYILALITSKAGLDYKKAIYFALNEGKHTLVYRSSFYNMDIFEGRENEDEDRFGKMLKDKEMEEERLEIPMREEDSFWQALCDNTVLHKKETARYFIKSSSKAIEFTNCLIVPVEYESKKYGVIVAEKFKDDVDVDEEEIDILKILSMNLALFFENKRLEHEGIQNEKLLALVKLSKGIVHELRTPITGIVGFANIVKKNYPNEKLIQEYMSVVIKESERIDNMAADLIEYADSEKSEMKLEKVNLRSVMTSVLEKLEEDIEQNQIEVTNDIDKDVFVYGEKNSLSKALLYLLKNSIEASKKREPSIKISALDNHRKVILSIRDNGIGIPEEKLEHIFEPLVTTKLQGTGMGLSIVRNIINRHSAKIDIISKENVGTEVSIVFDIAAKKELEQ